MKKKLRSILRSVRIRVSHFLGSLSHRQRKLPEFLIIGVQKGGTSSLFYYLKFHPQIKRAIKKEIHYFNLFYEKGLKWYKAHFPRKSDKYLTLEASPDYFFHPESAKRIKELNPQIKLIVLLRDPIERAYSAYQMNRRMGIDPRTSFEDAVSFELEQAKIIGDNYNYERHNFFYLERGLYAKQLKTWLEHFDLDQIHVIKSEIFFKDTNDELLKVYKFLGIEVKLPINLKAMNVGKYPNMQKDTYIRLKDYFDQDNSQLKALCQIEF